MQYKIGQGFGKLFTLINLRIPGYSVLSLTDRLELDPEASHLVLALSHRQYQPAYACLPDNPPMHCNAKYFSISGTY